MAISLAERKKVLNGLGFETYGMYLRSDLWAIIKKEIHRRDAGFCRMAGCGLPGKTIRHLSYSEKTLTGNSPASLITVCEKCLNIIRFDDEDQKRDFEEETILTFRMVMGRRVKTGESSPAVGNWFRDNIQMNLPVQVRIQQLVQEKAASF